MGKEAELSELASAALKAAEAGETSRCAGALAQLGKFAVTVELLKTTGAGKRLRTLTKHADGEVAAAAKGVIGTWKKVLEAEVGSGAAKQEKAKEGAGDTGGAGAKPSAKEEKPAAVAAAPVKKEAFKGTGDSQRDSVIGKLAEALALASEDVPEADTTAVAADVEAAMFAQFGAMTKEYKAKYRQLSFNLKDPRNPDLRRSVLMRMIAADTLVGLPSEQLGSNELREQNEKIRKDALFECQRGIKDEETTDQFQCGKCKQRKCKYFQMQTRSADEPMTTFVTCVNCGNRWKFC